MVNFGASGSRRLELRRDSRGLVSTTKIVPPDALWLSSVKLERFKAAFMPPAVHLGKFNLIVGRNGSGKSTLLEALQWVDGTLRQDARTALERYFGIHDVINVRSQLSPLRFSSRLAGQESRRPIRSSMR